MTSSSYNSHSHSCITPNEIFDSKGNCFKQNNFSKSTSFTTQAFKVNRDYLNKEFYQDYNMSYQRWFFSYFPKDMQQLFKTINYTHFKKIDENIPFLDWLNDFLSNHQISIPDQNKYYYATKRKLWHNIFAKETTISIHPSISIQPSSSSPKLKFKTHSKILL